MIIPGLRYTKNHTTGEENTEQIEMFVVREEHDHYSFYLYENHNLRFVTKSELLYFLNSVNDDKTAYVRMFIEWDNVVYYLDKRELLNRL